MKRQRKSSEDSSDDEASYSNIAEQGNQSNRRRNRRNRMHSPAPHSYNLRPRRLPTNHYPHETDSVIYINTTQRNLSDIQVRNSNVVVIPDDSNTSCHMDEPETNASTLSNILHTSDADDEQSLSTSSLPDRTSSSANILQRPCDFLIGDTILNDMLLDSYSPLNHNLLNVVSLESNTNSTGNSSTATNSTSNSATIVSSNCPKTLSNWDIERNFNASENRIISNDSRVSFNSKSNVILGADCDASTNNCKSTTSRSSAEKEDTCEPCASHSIQNHTIPDENSTSNYQTGESINETPNTDTINSDVNFDTLIDASEYVPNDANISSTENSQFDEIFNPQREN